MNKGGFSWKRLTGVSRAKSRISRTVGIPLTKSGRQRKVGKIVTGGGGEGARVRAHRGRTSGSDWQKAI